MSDLKITSSCSPGSLLYAGREIVDICDGVRLGLRGLRVVVGAVFPLVAPPFVAPASCSAVNSLVPFCAGLALVERGLNKEGRRPVFVAHVRMPNRRKIARTTNIGIYSQGTHENQNIRKIRFQARTHTDVERPLPFELSRLVKANGVPST